MEICFFMESVSYILTMIIYLLFKSETHSSFTTAFKGHFLNEENTIRDIITKRVSSWTIIFRENYSIHILKYE